MKETNMKKPIVFSDEVRNLAESSADPLIRDSQDELVQIQDLSEFFAEKYDQWTLLPPDAFFAALLEVNGNHEAMNRLYWMDVGRLATPYSICALWRASELAIATAKLANENNWLAAATTARALLELSATFMLAISNCHSQVKQNLPSSEAGFAPVKGLHEVLDVAFVGTKNKGYQDFGFPEPNKICEILRAAGKQHNDDCLEVYKSFCDFAHPNLSGTAYYWGDDARVVNSRGEIMRSIGPNIKNELRHELKLKVLWTIGWTCLRTRESMQMVNSVGKSLKVRFPSEAPANMSVVN